MAEPINALQQQRPELLQKLQAACMGHAAEPAGPVAAAAGQFSCQLIG